MCTPSPLLCSGETPPEHRIQPWSGQQKINLDLPQPDQRRTTKMHRGLSISTTHPCPSLQDPRSLCLRSYRGSLQCLVCPAQVQELPQPHILPAAARSSSPSQPALGDGSETPVVSELRIFSFRSTGNVTVHFSILLQGEQKSLLKCLGLLWKEDSDFPTGNRVAETAEIREEIRGCQSLQFLF